MNANTAKKLPAQLNEFAKLLLTVDLKDCSSEKKTACQKYAALFLAICAKARDKHAWQGWKDKLTCAGYSTEIPISTKVSISKDLPISEESFISKDSPALAFETDDSFAQRVNPDVPFPIPGLTDRRLNPITKPFAKKTHSSFNLFSEEERHKRLKSSSPALAEAPYEQILQSPLSEDKEVSAQADEEPTHPALSYISTAQFFKLPTHSKRSVEDDPSTSKRGKPDS